MKGNVNGQAANAEFNVPNGITVDSYRDFYVAEIGNNVIPKITPDAVLSTFAGDGCAGVINGAGMS